MQIANAILDVDEDRQTDNDRGNTICPFHNSSNDLA